MKASCASSWQPCILRNTGTCCLSQCLPVSGRPLLLLSRQLLFRLLQWIPTCPLRAWRAGHILHPSLAKFMHASLAAACTIQSTRQSTRHDADIACRRQRQVRDKCGTHQAQTAAPAQVRAAEALLLHAGSAGPSPGQLLLQAPARLQRWQLGPLPSRPAQGVKHQ